MVFNYENNLGVFVLSLNNNTGGYVYMHVLQCWRELKKRENVNQNFGLYHQDIVRYRDGATFSSYLVRS